MGPPPEKPEAVRQRSYIVLSFWAVILFLGVPTWWKTTSIPRAALPVQQMINWESQRPSYTVDVRIATPDLTCDQAHNVISNTQTLLDQKNVVDGFRLRVQLVYFEETHNENTKNVCKLPRVPADDSSSALDLQLNLGRTFHVDIHGTEHYARVTYSPDDMADLGTKLSDTLRNIFSDEEAAVAYQYYTKGFSTPAIDEYVQRLPQEVVVAVERNAARAFKASPDYHLTFSLFTAGGTPSSWDIDSVSRHYIRPILHSLSATTNFSITTQIQLYSAFSPAVQPFQVDGEPGLFLSETDLTAFVNAAEWPLPPSIGFGPTINFILYVPAKDQLPLRIADNRGGSWLIPQWGGITILNPPLVANPDTTGQKITPHLDHKILMSSFQTFQTQLLSLLGVSSNPSLPLSVRLKAFQRLTGFSLYFRTAANLGSLARLSQRLSNIPIPHHVLGLVESAGQGLRSYSGEGLASAVRAAYSSSEKAFFDKSMVGQVYFPDEHKVAVYLPLLGPIGVPLLVALLRELKQRFSAK